MTATLRTIACMMLLMSATVAELRAQNAQTVNLFESREYRCTEGQFQGTVFRYRLFVPRLMKPGEHYPLIVWMHGHGNEPGTNNVGQLAWVDFMLNDPYDVEKYRFFVVVVQCPQKHTWSEQTGSVGTDDKRPDDMLTVTADIVRKTMKECPVDPNRVYAMGVSSGAAASLELAMRDPRLYAAVVPLACLGSDESRAAKLVTVPIWAFVNNGERAGVERMVAAVQTAGGNAHLTVADAWGHDAWSSPLKGGILDWILAQRRGGPCWIPPGHDAWQWWHVLTIPATIVVFVRLAWSLEQWRRRRQGRQAEQNAERTSQSASVLVISLSRWEKENPKEARAAKHYENRDSCDKLPSS